MSETIIMTDDDRPRSRRFTRPALEAETDGRSRTRRRFADLVAELTEALPERKRTPVNNILIRRAASLLVRLEQLDASVAAGEDANLHLHNNLTATTLKLLTTLGLAMPPASASKSRSRDGLDDDPLEAYLNTKGYSLRPDDVPGPDIDEDDDRPRSRRASPPPDPDDDEEPEPRRAASSRRIKNGPGRPRKRVRLEEES